MHPPLKPGAQRGHNTPGGVPAIHTFASQNLPALPQLQAEQRLNCTRRIPPTFEFCATTPPNPAAAQLAIPVGYQGNVGPPLTQVSFEIVAECPHTRARAGLLHTPHGVIETPVFMPVGTQATVKGLTQRDLAEDLGVAILLANTYHLYLRPGH